MANGINDVVRSSEKVPEFNKHLKKAGGYIDRNVVKITIESLKTQNDKNHQTSSQKFRQISLMLLMNH